MTYQEFIPKVQKTVQNNLPEGVLCNVKQITKNNGLILNGLVISEESTNIFPTIYLENYYEDYVEGESIDNVACNIVRQYHINKFDEPIDISFFNDFEKVKSRIVYKLINRSKNSELLTQIPWIPHLDLAICFYYLMCTDEEKTATILIRNEHISSWDVDAQALWDISKENTPQLLAYDLKSMSEFLQDICDNDTSLGNNMLVLTNCTKSFGASSILYPNILKEIAKRLDDDFYIIPSSIHEMMFIPALENCSRAELDSLVCQVNESMVSAEDILSDHVYYYSREQDCIC